MPHRSFIGRMWKTLFSQIIFRRSISLKEFQEKLNDRNFSESFKRIFTYLDNLLFWLLTFAKSYFGKDPWAKGSKDTNDFHSPLFQFIQNLFEFFLLLFLLRDICDEPNSVHISVCIFSMGKVHRSHVFVVKILYREVSKGPSIC